MPPREVFVTGGTGYIGSRLIWLLIARGHTVRALIRESSRSKLPAECQAIVGDALDAATFVQRVAPADTFVQLVGTPHPSPRKAAEFRRVDLGSARASISAASSAEIRHFVYLSVAHPAPIMREYIAARVEAEQLLRQSGLKASIFRPWYILGPGHRWPYLLIPFYAAMSLYPDTRETAQRLGLVSLKQMVMAIAKAIEDPPKGVRVLSVPDIRRSGRAI